MPHQVRQLRIIQVQRHLRNILKIKWDQYVINEEVFAGAELKLLTSHLRWLGHASRMEDERPVRALLLGELNNRKRPLVVQNH